jgi:hypothetical protein
MNATNVIRIDFRRKAPAAHAPISLVRSPPSGRAHDLVYHVAASMTLAFACWLASLVSLLALWLPRL